MYKKKYEKYKKKYMNLKQQMKSECDIYNYYFIHSTTDYNNLKDILESGIIYPGKYLKRDQQKLTVDSEFVYANIYFEDLNNIPNLPDFGLLIHPKILYENGMYFHKGWTGPKEGDIHIKTTNTPIQISKKLKQIREFIKNPLSLPKIIQNFPGTHHHEVYFDHPIKLNSENLIGIVCNYCDKAEYNFETWEKYQDTTDKPLRKLKKIIEGKPYYNVKVITQNYPLPELKDLLES
nr:hypothetical protein [Megavirus caiporensis]